MPFTANSCFKLYMVIYLISTIWLIVGTVQGHISFTEYWVLKEKRDFYSKRIDHLESEANSLAQEIERVANSKEYARKVLREKYHLLEENEKIFFFSE